MIIAIAILIIALVGIAIIFYMAISISGENLSNKICKQSSQYVDSPLLIALNIRPTHLVCDILTPV